MRPRRPFLDLDGAVVVVTGASSGIGRLTARRLACRGARVVLAARSRGDLDDAVGECRAEGGQAVAVVTDVSDEASVTALAEEAERRFGRVDAWVNNAGVMAYGHFDEVPMDAHRQVLETNVLGAIYSAAQAVPRFRRQRRGVLVNVASLYAEMTTPLVSSYITSKFGLLGFSRALRRDLRPADRIRVCCVLPASVDTPIFRHAANHFGRVVRAIPPVVDPDRVARAIVGCLEHPRQEVRVGFVGRFYAWGEKLMPPVYDRVVNRGMQVLGFHNREAPADDGNLYQPADDWQQVVGGWRNDVARQASLGVAAGALAAGAAVAARNRT